MKSVGYVISIFAIRSGGWRAKPLIGPLVLMPMCIEIFPMCQQENIPYYVRMRVKNCAGLSVELHSPPILIDKTVPSSGVVKDGPDFQSDILWLRDNTKVTGMASSTAVPEKKKMLIDTFCCLLWLLLLLFP